MGLLTGKGPKLSETNKGPKLSETNGDKHRYDVGLLSVKRPSLTGLGAAYSKSGRCLEEGPLQKHHPEVLGLEEYVIIQAPQLVLAHITPGSKRILFT